MPYKPPNLFMTGSGLVQYFVMTSSRHHIPFKERMLPSVFCKRQAPLGACREPPSIFTTFSNIVQDLFMTFQDLFRTC